MIYIYIYNIYIYIYTLWIYTILCILHLAKNDSEHRIIQVGGEDFTRGRMPGQIETRCRCASCAPTGPAAGHVRTTNQARGGVELPIRTAAGDAVVTKDRKAPRAARVAQAFEVMASDRKDSTRDDLHCELLGNRPLFGITCNCARYIDAVVVDAVNHIVYRELACNRCLLQQPRIRRRRRGPCGRLLQQPRIRRRRRRQCGRLRRHHGRRVIRGDCGGQR